MPFSTPVFGKSRGGVAPPPDKNVLPPISGSSWRERARGTNPGRARGNMAFDIEQLAEGIRWVMSQRETGRLAEQARERAVARFAYSVVAKEYAALYSWVLNEVVS